MNIGELNKRLVIQTLTTTQDSSGSQTESYADTETVWGAIWPDSGKEYIAQSQITGELTGTIRIRYRTGMTIKRRFKFGSRIFDIQNIINPGENNKWLDCRYIERFSDA